MNKHIDGRKLTLQNIASKEMKLQLWRLRVHLLILNSIHYDSCPIMIPFMSINLSLQKVIYNVGFGFYKRKKEHDGGSWRS